jgi:hypothetical protein
MDYNTTRKQLVLPEYGRNIQKMINHIKTVEDREERNKLANAVIHIMGNMNPHLRDVGDFKHKLWDHLAIISDFELDVDFPYPLPEKEELVKAPEKITYNDKRDVNFLHYGRLIESMIHRAVDYPEGEERDYLIETLGNQMKKSYITYNREVVGDDQIFRDMIFISHGKLTIPEGLTLKETKDLKNKMTTPGKMASGGYQKNQKKPMQRKHSNNNSGGGRPYKKR